MTGLDSENAPPSALTIAVGTRYGIVCPGKNGVHCPLPPTATHAFATSQETPLSTFELPPEAAKWFTVETGVQLPPLRETARVSLE